MTGPADKTYPPLQSEPRNLRPPFEEPDYRDRVMQKPGETIDEWRKRFHANFLSALMEPLAGIELGNQDHAIIDWLAGWDIGTIGTIASLFYRCRQAGPIERKDGSR